MTGNGLFILGMARKRKDLNFLGLEINEKVFAFFFFFSPCCLNHRLIIVDNYFLQFFSARKALSRFCSTIYH